MFPPLLQPALPCFCWNFIIRCWNLLCKTRSPQLLKLGHGPSLTLHITFQWIIQHFRKYRGWKDVGGRVHRIDVSSLKILISTGVEEKTERKFQNKISFNSLRIQHFFISFHGGKILRYTCHPHRVNTRLTPPAFE